MDGRRARLVAPLLDRVPTLQRGAPQSAPAAASTSAPAGEERLRSGWAVILGLGWPLTFLISLALEPAPAHPEAAPAILVELAGMAFLVALWFTVIAAVRRHPMAATPAVLTGLLAVGFSITCPLSGHHTFGLWWVAQLGLTATMLGASAAARGPRARTDD